MSRAFSMVGWLCVFVAAFWIDDWFLDPAALKAVLLPFALTIVLVHSWDSLSASRWLLWGILPFGWALVRTGEMASPAAVGVGIGAGLLGFLVGKSGARPPTWVAFLALSLATARGWADLLLGHNWGGGIPGTVTSFFVHKNLFGLLLGPSLLLLLYWLLDAARPSRFRLWAWILLLTGGGLFVLVQSRGAQIGFLVGGGVLLGWRWRTPRPGGVQAGLVAVSLALAVGLAVIARDRIGQASEEYVALAHGEIVRTEVPTRFRPWVWQGAFDLWKANPWLGCGTGDFTFEIESRVQPWMDSWRERGVRIGVAHSHWLHVLAERGLIGLVLEAGLFLVACVAAFLHRQRGILAALLALGVHAFVAEGFEYAAGSAFLWWCIGFALQGTSRNPLPSWGRWVLGAILLVPLALRARELRGEFVFGQLFEAPPEKRSALILDAVATFPRNPSILLELSRMQAVSGDREGAANTLFHLRELYPSPNAVFMERPLAGALLLARREDEALDVLSEPLRLYPYDPLLVDTWLDAVETRWGCPVRTRAMDSLRPSMDQMLIVRSRVANDGNLVRQREASVFNQAGRDWSRIRDQGCRAP